MTGLKKKWQNPTIFVELTYGHFYILMSQRGQMRKKWAFLGCAKIMLRLHTARTAKLHSPQTHPSASDVHEYPSDTPRHPPDIPQTPARYLQGAQEANRRQQTNRHHQTHSNSTCQCLGVSEAVSLCLLASVVFWWHIVFSGDLVGVYGGCCGVHLGVSRR